MELRYPEQNENDSGDVHGQWGNVPKVAFVEHLLGNHHSERKDHSQRNNLQQQ